MAPLPISQGRFKRICYLSPDIGPKSTMKMRLRRNGSYSRVIVFLEQVNDFRLWISVSQKQQPYGYRQFETSRPCASGVYKKHIVSSHD